MLMNKIGHKNLTLLSKMLDLHGQAQKVIAQNIANVNTPNYMRRQYKFDRALREAMGAGTAYAYRNMNGWLDRPKVTPVRNNGNNVDIDLEMVNMRENAFFYQMYTHVYNKRSGLVKRAITGGK